MKKRFLAVLLTLCMVLSLLPVSAFAAPGGSEYEIGDTFETTDPDQKPPENIPDGTEWVGPTLSGEILPAKRRNTPTLWTAATAMTVYMSTMTTAIPHSGEVYEGGQSGPL